MSWPEFGLCRQVILVLMRRVLTSLSIAVVTAMSGEEALERCKDSGPFDVVFMDLYMPGISATAEIRQRQLVAAHVPIYVLTASVSQGIEAECLAVGDARVDKAGEKEDPWIFYFDCHNRPHSGPYRNLLCICTIIQQHSFFFPSSSSSLP